MGGGGCRSRGVLRSYKYKTTVSTGALSAVGELIEVFFVHKKSQPDEGWLERHPAEAAGLGVHERWPITAAGT
ncbi:hypothetical protein BN2497_10367 [Janthinobacterium sp. CG23_2]|nr:hypothetical protein BN2497_10367 [Janthinobacterium sp. CG23_2]CUU31581.1 hypothetical protein BN3177_10367 [Janthinobacterium sp. CG23_2]